jgi:hypothetical protein
VGKLKKINVTLRAFCLLLGHRFVLVWYGPFTVELYCGRCRRAIPTATILGGVHEKVNPHMSMWRGDK